MKRALIVGGSSGIGLSMAVTLAGRKEVSKVYIVDKAPFPQSHQNGKIDYYHFDLMQSDYSLFDTFTDIDALIVTAGFGRLALFKDIDEGAFVYFVHSYYLKAKDPSIVTATTDYGCNIHASVEKGNIFTCQFHPEKSSTVGLKILENFAKL
jgi:NAD(P)-dependent dehydrogenase (short-subunit alcohol dehydrogenase family)